MDTQLKIFSLKLLLFQAEKFVEQVMFEERRSPPDRHVWITARSPHKKKKKKSLSNCAKSMSPQYPVCTSNQAQHAERSDSISEPKDLIAFNVPENKLQSKQESEILPSAIKVKTEEPELDLGVNVIGSDKENEFIGRRVSPEPVKVEENAVKKEDLGPRFCTKTEPNYIQVGR